MLGSLTMYQFLQVTKTIGQSELLKPQNSASKKNERNHLREARHLLDDYIVSKRRKEGAPGRLPRWAKPSTNLLYS
jgi:hypothetical protein